MSYGVIVLLETTGHRLPITLQLLRFCLLPRARFFFRLFPFIKNRDKKLPMTLIILQDVIGLSH